MLSGVPAAREWPQNRWWGSGAGDDLTTGAGDDLTTGNWRFFRGCRDCVVQTSPKAVPLRGQLRQTSSNEGNRIFKLVEVGDHVVEVRRHAKPLDEEGKKRLTTFGTQG